MLISFTNLARRRAYRWGNRSGHLEGST